MLSDIREQELQASGARFVPYGGIFPNLIRGRQEEFLIYREMYKLSDDLRNDFRLNIYDQITDIDGADVLIRCEAPHALVYLEAQVRRTKGRLDYAGRKTPLKHLVERSRQTGSRFVVFAVDYTSAPDTGEPTVHFYTGPELRRAHQELNVGSFGLRKLDDYLGRPDAPDAWIPVFKSYLEDELQKGPTPSSKAGP